MVGEPDQGAAGAAPESSTTYERGSAASTQSPLSVDSMGGAYEERPEMFVGAAFVGGFVVAQILKKVGQ